MDIHARQLRVLTDNNVLKFHSVFILLIQADEREIHEPYIVISFTENKNLRQLTPNLNGKTYDI